MGLRAHRFGLRAALALVALALSACGAASAGPAPTTTSTVPPISYDHGATVTVAVPRIPAELNPWTPTGANATTAEMMDQVWPQATAVDNNFNELVCTEQVTSCPSQLLVSAEPVSITPLTIVYVIAPKATWSDGVPITGQDFVYLWQHVRQLGWALPANEPVTGYDDIASISAPGNGKTVTVVFSKPYADWESLFDDLVPAHVAERYGFAAAFTGHDVARVVSGGPFQIATLVPGRELVLVRNPKFWGPPARVARIVFRVEASDAAALRALRRGTVTVAAVTPGPAASQAVAASTHLASSTSLSPLEWEVAFNLADPVVGSLSVRSAIADAVDRHQLIADSVGLLTPAAQTSGNRLYPNAFPGSAGNDSDYQAVEIAGAETLLSAAGYTLGADGIMEGSSGIPLTLSLVGPSGNPVVDEVEAQLQAELLQVGIVLHLRNTALSVLLKDVLPRGDYQLALTPYLVSPYPSTTARLYTDPVGPRGATIRLGTATSSTSTTAAVPTPAPAEPPTGSETEPGAVVAGAVTRDVLGFEDTGVDQLYSEAFSQLNSASAAGEYNKIDQMLWQDLPTLPLFQMPVTLVYNNALLNLTNSVTWAGFLWNAQNWTIERNAPSTVTTLAGPG